MEIKPIKLIDKIKPAELPDSRIGRDRASPNAPVPLKSGQWQYFRGSLLVNGKEITTLMEEALQEPPSTWSVLGEDLKSFLSVVANRYARKKIRKKNSSDLDDFDELDPSGELSRLASLVEAYSGKVLRILKKKYDEKKDGFSYTIDEEGQLVLNGVNVTAFLHTAHTYPSDKAKIFLRGLKNRLSYILTNKSNNANYEKIREATEKIFRQIDEEIVRIIEKERLLST